MEIIISNSMGEFIKKVHGEIIRIIQDFGNKNGLCTAVIKVNGIEETQFVLRTQQ